MLYIVHFVITMFSGQKDGKVALKGFVSKSFKKAGHPKYGHFVILWGLYFVQRDYLKEVAKK